MSGARPRPKVLPEVIDYNGQGRWSRREVVRRYLQYADELRVAPRDISPSEYGEKGVCVRVYPIMDKVIDGIEAGDRACVALGVEFIEEDAKFPFGKILKSNTARALRRAALTTEQQGRVRRRVLGMLRAGHVPHEYREYAKLLRRVGFDRRTLEAVGDHLDRNDRYVVRFYNYFERVLDGVV